MFVSEPGYPMAWFMCPKELALISFSFMGQYRIRGAFYRHGHDRCIPVLVIGDIEVPHSISKSMSPSSGVSKHSDKASPLSVQGTEVSLPIKAK